MEKGVFEDKERNISSQRNNIFAARAVADAVRSTLGPQGMDKMLVDSTGDITVTNDGVTILRQMHIEHPAAKLVVEIAKTQEEMVGDGTTTVAILAGELLKRAETLLDMGIHPAIIIKGLRIAEQFVQKTFEEISKPVTLEDQDLLLKIAKTAMAGKNVPNLEELAMLIVKAFQRTKDKEEIKIESIIGKKSELVEGIVIDKERVHPSMPKQIYNAKIALLNSSLEIRNPEIDAKIQITDPSQLQAFLNEEERSLQEMVHRIIQTGANVILSQKGIDELAQHYLAQNNIFAVRRIRKSDMEKLARATGGNIINNWKDISSTDLGTAGIVHEQNTNEPLIFVEQCPQPKAVTLLVKGSTNQGANEIKRAVEDSLGDLHSAYICQRVVAGAGAPEILAARKLKQYNVGGKEQFAIEILASTLESIPHTLAENAGLDAIETLSILRVSHLDWPGVNVEGGVLDAWQAGIIEPLEVKTQAISSAVQVAEMILRIDDVILAKRE